jgi:maleate isomerase
VLAPARPRRLRRWPWRASLAVRCARRSWKRQVGTKRWSWRSNKEVGILGYACLVAIISMGDGYHRGSERRLRGVAAENGRDIPVVTSAGAFIQGLQTLGAKKVSIITPYMKPLTKLVKSYIEAEDITVLDTISLGIANNIKVGSRDPMELVRIVDDLKINGADAVVVSACVQMPSLESIP